MSSTECQSRHETVLILSGLSYIGGRSVLGLRILARKTSRSDDNRPAKATTYQSNTLTGQTCTAILFTGKDGSCHGRCTLPRLEFLGCYTLDRAGCCYALIHRVLVWRGTAFALTSCARVTVPYGGTGSDLVMGDTRTVDSLVSAEIALGMTADRRHA